MPLLSHPDLQKATFTGDETLDVEVNKASSEFTLNAVDLDFRKLPSVQKRRKTQVAKWGFAADKEQVHADSRDALEPDPPVFTLSSPVN